MSGTRSPSRKAPLPEAEPGRWPVWKLALLLYPFAAPAVAVNLFLLGLISHQAGLAAMTPVTALWLSVPLGVPTGWLLGRWVRGLLDEAARGVRKSARAKS